MSEQPPKKRATPKKQTAKPLPQKKSKVQPEKMEMLMDFSRKNLEEKSLGGLLNLLADEAKILLQADRCTIFVLDHRKKILWSKVAQGSQNVISFPWDKGIAGASAQTGQPVNISDAYQDSRFNPEIDRITGYHTQNILTVPMKNIQQEVLGVFQVLNKMNGSGFNDEDVELLTLLACQAGAAVENLRGQITHERQESFESNQFISLKPGSNHDLRLRQYTFLVAQEINLDKFMGEDGVPIEGKITALADVFDVLTAKSTGQGDFRVEAALSIIREGKGRHYDALVVEAFERALPKIIEVMHKYADPSNLV